jgi:hypothetical protein
MMLLLGCATWYQRHLTDAGQQSAYVPLALEEMTASVRHLRDGMADLIARIDAGVGALAHRPAAAE